MSIGAHLAVAPMLVALVAGTVALVSRRWRRVQQAASLAGVLAYALVVGIVVWRVVLAPDAPGAVAYQLGGWPAPFGISLVVDGLSAFMLVLTAAVAVPAVTFSIRFVEPADQQVFYHPLVHFLLLGVTGAFLTGDLFNLFVWFEVLLMASYVLIAFYGGPAHTQASMRFVVLNLLASAVMLVAIGGIYGITGTLNMADVARRVADPAAYGVAPGPVVGLLGLLLSVFALKAGLVPFHFWVPSAYDAAPLPVTALLAGATKKVGIYAILRLTFTVFSDATVPVDVPGVAGETVLAFVGPVLLVMAAASIVLGGLGAIQADAIEGVLAYSSVGQVGFIAVPIAVAALVPEVATVAILAALVYALNHALAKGMLFLSVGAIRSATGTSRLAALGGLSGQFPVLSGAFLIGALSLVGIPPLSGFFGKFLVFDAAVRAGSAAIVVLLVAGSILTIAYTTRVWTRAFWSERPEAVARGTADHVEVAVLVALAVAVVAVGVGFEPVYEFAEAAAEAAVDTDSYVDTVDPDGGEGQ